MTADDALAALRPWIAEQERPAWKPVAEDADGPAGDSKFAGTPLLIPGEDWPACGNCGEPTELFLQLDLSALPAELGGRYGGGVLQLFYCVGDCDGGWGPFNEEGVSLCRMLPPGAGEPAAEARGTFPPKRIAGWERFADPPGYDAREAAGLVREYGGKSGDPGFGCTAIRCEAAGVNLTGADAGALADLLNFDHALSASAGDKLAGWPYWVQGEEYPDCPECGGRMELLFQLDSEDHVPFMFGDVGVGHVTQCPAHKTVVAFGWACS